MPKKRLKSLSYVKELEKSFTKYLDLLARYIPIKEKHIKRIDKIASEIHKEIIKLRKELEKISKLKIEKKTKKKKK